MFFVELVCPLFIFFERTRIYAGFAFIGLMLLVAATGNFTFFNWLTIVIAIWLIPDSFWRFYLETLPLSARLNLSWAPLRHLISAVCCVLIAINTIFCVRWLLPSHWDLLFSGGMKLVQPYHVSSAYGLFANMTQV